MANEAQQNIANLLETWGVSFSARLIGETKRDDWVCDEWRVSIGSFETSYYTGTGHRKMNVAVAPCAADVLYALLSDAEACETSFSDWCENFGYSNDSIKALNTYRECEELGRSLRKVFSTKQVSELREVLSDY